MDNHEFCQFVSNIAIKSILFEVTASPKPGLVDRYNSGAHKDMDFFTFMRSSSVLYPYFYNCTKAGMDFEGNDFKELLLKMRPIGIKAEEDMFKATHGINTHKGILFSRGIIAAAAGSLFKESGERLLDALEISRRTQLISKDITKELESSHHKANLTYGEILYLKHGTKGIRGEVESGFQTVMDISLPVLEELVSEGTHCINDILIQVLLHLMKNTEDSNVLGRHNMAILNFVQEESKEALILGGCFTKKGNHISLLWIKILLIKILAPVVLRIYWP